jgi:predicted ABC-type ATPase
MDDKTYVASFSQKLAEFRGKYGRKGQVGGSAKNPTADVVPIGGGSNTHKGIDQKPDSSSTKKFLVTVDVTPKDEAALADALSFTSPTALKYLQDKDLTRDQIYEKINNARIAAVHNTDSRSLHAPNGEYSAERKKTHEDIVNRMLEGKPEQVSDARVLITGGLPGSGKTTMLKAGGYTNFVNESVSINADDLKGELAKADGITDWGTLAGVYHEESSDLAARLTQIAVERRMNMVLDKTMQNPAKMIKTIELMKTKGYKTEAVFAKLPLSKAIERGIFRFLHTNRFVDPVIIAAYDSDPENTMNVVKKVVDVWAIWDTDVPFGQSPILLDSGDMND